MCPLWEPGHPAGAPARLAMSVPPAPFWKAPVPMKPSLPSAFVSPCQGPTAVQSTGPLCLLASTTVVLEYVSFKLRSVSLPVSPQRPRCSVPDPGHSPGTPACFSQNSPSLRGCLCHSRTLCASLTVTLRVPMSLPDTPLIPQSLAPGGLISCLPGRWEGHGIGRAHSHLERVLLSQFQLWWQGSRRGLPSVRPQAPQPWLQLAPQAGVASFPWGKSHQPPLTSRILCSFPLSAQRPFLGVVPSVSPSRVCPPSLAWCLQLWSPPPAHGQHHPAQVSFLRAPLQPQAGPIPSPGTPSPGLAQRSCSPLSSSSPAHPGKRLQLGEGSSISSSAAACCGQRAQPGNAVATGGGAVWTQAPLCPA